MKLKEEEDGNATTYGGSSELGEPPSPMLAVIDTTYRQVCPNCNSAECGNLNFIDRIRCLKNKMLSINKNFIYENNEINNYLNSWHFINKVVIHDFKVLIKGIFKDKDYISSKVYEFKTKEEAINFYKKAKELMNKLQYEEQELENKDNLIDENIEDWMDIHGEKYEDYIDDDENTISKYSEVREFAANVIENLSDFLDSIKYKDSIKEYKYLKTTLDEAINICDKYLLNKAFIELANKTTIELKNFVYSYFIQRYLNKKMDITKELTIFVKELNFSNDLQKRGYKVDYNFGEISNEIK